MNIVIHYFRRLSHVGNLVIQPIPHNHITDTLYKGLVVAYSKFLLYHVLKTKAELIPVITVEPADKISFVYNCMQTRLRGQYNGK